MPLPPVTLTFLTLKLLSESRVMLATSLPILVCLDDGGMTIQENNREQ